MPAFSWPLVYHSWNKLYFEERRKEREREREKKRERERERVKERKRHRKKDLEVGIPNCLISRI